MRVDHGPAPGVDLLRDPLRGQRAVDEPGIDLRLDRPRDARRVQVADERAGADLRRPAEEERRRAQPLDPGGGRAGIGLGDVAQAVRPGLQRREREVGPDGGRGVVLRVDVVVAAEPAPLLRGEPAPQPGPDPDLAPLLGLHVHLQRLVVRPAPQGDRGAARRHLHGEARLGEEAAVGVDAPPGAVRMGAVARGDDHADRQGHRPLGSRPAVLDLDDDPRPGRRRDRGLPHDREGRAVLDAGREEEDELGRDVDHGSLRGHGPARRARSAGSPRGQRDPRAGTAIVPATRSGARTARGTVRDPITRRLGRECAAIGMAAPPITAPARGS